MDAELRKSKTIRLSRYQGEKPLHPRRYITGFDGIRTLAVLGVIIYHLMPSALVGGYLGVPIFFVVSGYLITDILLQDWSARGSIRIMRFYGHRMRRLYPAFVTMLLGTTAYITIFQRSLLSNIRATVLTNLFYVYNWFEINHGQSYFDRFNGESPFTHLWSLSIEGQYYLFWPLMIVLMMLFFKKKSRVFFVMMILACLSAFFMGILYNSANTNRVYYGTDTRLFAVLLGSGLAFIWPSRELSANINRLSRIILDISGAFALIVIIWSFFNLSGQDAWTYKGGMFLFTIFSAVLVAVVAHPASHINEWLTNPIFKYIGERSYGIYLYQFPVMVFYETKFRNVGEHPIFHSFIEIAIIFLVTEFSYRLIEDPWRHYDYRELFRNLHSFVAHPNFHRSTALMLTLGTTLFLITAVGFVQQPSSESINKPDALQQKITTNKKSAIKKNALALKHQKQMERSADNRVNQDHKTVINLTSKQKQIEKSYQLKPEVVKLMTTTNLTAIGDSVLLDVSSDLQSVIPGTIVQGRVGRQMTEVPSVIRNMKSSGELAHNVLLNIGTNGTITNDQAEQAIKMIGKSHQIFWVTAHVPTQSWQNQVNAQIRKTARQYRNVHVIDWHKKSQNQTNWFASDNVHPNELGNKKLTALIANEIAANNYK